MATMVGVTDQERTWFTNAQKDYEVASNDQKTQEATEDIIKEGGNQKEILDTVQTLGKPMCTPTSSVLASASEHAPEKAVGLGAVVVAETPSVASSLA